MRDETSTPVPRVLLVGYRRALAEALRRQSIPFAVWHDQELSTVRRAIHVGIYPLETSIRQLRQHAAKFLALGPFTHCIAGTEAGVVPASVARRILGARKSRDSVVIACHDKLKMKETLSACGVPMTDFADPNVIPSPEALLERLGAPVVIKLRASSGSRGIAFAKDVNSVRANLHGPKIAERYVAAPELSVESFVQNGVIQFTNITRYHVKKHVNVVPGYYTADLTRDILKLNSQVIHGLKLRWGMTHVEMYLTENGPWFGEIALRPPGGYIMDLLQLAYDFNPWDAYLAIELGQPFGFPSSANKYAAATIIHPGTGWVSQIRGRQEVASAPGTVHFECEIEPGTYVSEREGVGQSIGYYLQTASHFEPLMSQVEWARQQLYFAMHPDPIRKSL